MADLTDDLEIIMLGTGTSGQLPNVSCLTDHLSAEPGPPCRTCLSTLDPSGSKNVRRNTSAVVRGTRPDGSKSTILIDCGKSFLSSALEFFPKNGLRQIDAVLLTHPHADAINGLDDLRGWTLKGVVQPFIKIYCSAFTLKEIAASWPYMVETSRATGGGDVPAFEWHVIDEERDFIVEGIRITPLNVHHGRFFSPKPAPGTPPSTPEPVQPYFCLGFIFHPHIVYLSDVSFIPPAVWDKLLLTDGARSALEGLKADPDRSSTAASADWLTPPASPPTTPEDELLADAGVLSSPLAGQPRKPWPVVLLDCLFLTTHTSHFGLLDALGAVLRLGAAKTYLFGFAHHVAHEEWEALGRELDGSRIAGDEDAFVVKAMAIGGEVAEQVREKQAFVRPAFDGLRLVCRRADAEGPSTVEECEPERAILPASWASHQSRPAALEDVQMAEQADVPCCSSCAA